MRQKGIIQFFTLEETGTEKIDSKHLLCILSKEGTEIKFEIARNRISELIDKMKQ